MKLFAWFWSWGAALNRAMGWPFSRLNLWLYRRTRGVLGGAIPGGKVILLTTKGHRTGQPHTVPLASWSDGADMIVGVMSTKAQWLQNLHADPTARVQIKRDSFDVGAEIIPGDLIRDVRSSIAKAYPLFEIYARRTPPHAPMVRLVRKA